MKDELEDIDFDSVGADFDDPDAEHAAPREIFGGSNNGKRSADGKGSDQPPRPQGTRVTEGDTESVRYYFFPTWRSQFLNLVAFFGLCVLGIVISRWIPALVMEGSLFSIGDTTYYLRLPLLILLPGFVLGKILVNIYDAKYIIDERGVEAQIGLVSLNLRQPRLRWEDIRGVEPTQTIWERLLGIGTVLVGSAMTQDVEIVMSGVANPRAIQLLIGAERDRKLQELQGAGKQMRVQHSSGLLGD